MKDVLHIVGLALLFIVPLAMARGCQSLSCDQVAETTGVPTQFRLISGCYVQVNGRWVPRDSWRWEEQRSMP